MNRVALLPLLVQTAAVLALCACTPGPAPSSSQDVLQLSGPWAFQPGDDLAWAAPGFNDSRWVRLQVPGSWRRQGFDGLRGLAWYRLRVGSRWPADGVLGLTLGKIDSAYEVYAGGRHLGGVGALPPAPRMEYDRHVTYSIPPALRDADGSVVVALRVWRDPHKPSTAAGPVEGPFEIGPLTRLIEREKVNEAQQLALVLVFVLVGVYHLSLRLRLGSGADYAWFGILALLAAIYGFLRTQWKYLLFDDFLVLKKIEHVVLWLIPAAILQFVWVFFNQPRPRMLILSQLVLVAGAATIAIAPGLTVPLTLLQYIQLSVVPLIAALMLLVYRRLVAGDREARLVGAGLAVLAATIAHDALVDRNYLIHPRVAIYGFAILVVGMSVTLGNRFQRALRDRDALLRELETRVDDRTRELTEAYQAMEELALHDSLTQVWNRRAIQNRAEGELARARRHGTSLAVAMIDIDHFKRINDTHGHAAGDRVLVAIAQRLVAAVRASDEIGRWGGEEFLVLMPGIDHHDAALAGERLRSLVAGTPIVVDGHGTHVVTVSIGLTALDGRLPDVPELDTLILRADEALYRAKADGRNSSRIADPVG